MRDVLPAPSGPVSTTRSPGRRSAARRSPSRRVAARSASPRRPAARARPARAARSRAPPSASSRSAAARRSSASPGSASAARACSGVATVRDQVTGTPARPGRGPRAAAGAARPAARSAAPRSGGRSAAPARAGPRRSTSCSRPRSDASVPGPRNQRAADSPSATTTAGAASSSWRDVQPRQVALSARVGGRLAGGRHFTVLSTPTSARSAPTSASSSSSSWPLRPTKGWPLSSSCAPGRLAQHEQAGAGRDGAGDDAACGWRPAPGRRCSRATARPARPGRGWPDAAARTACAACRGRRRPADALTRPPGARGRGRAAAAAPR